MKIVQLIDYFQPQVGYQETFLAREYIKKGYLTYVITSDRYFPFPNYETSYQPLLGKRILRSGIKKEQGIPTIRLHSLEIPGTNIIYLFRLKNTLKELKPDIVLCHGIYSLTSYLSSVYRKYIGYKLIYDSHAARFNTNFETSFPKKIYHYIFKKIFLPKLVKEYQSLFAIGEEEQEFICYDCGLDKNKVPIIRLGVDTDMFKHSQEKRKKIRSLLKLEEEDVIIIYAGKIAPNKDLGILLKSVQIIANNNLKVIFIGGGDIHYANKLRQLLDSHRLYLIDFVNNNQLPDYYSAADLGIWPGNPSASMIEALGAGLPLIVAKQLATTFLDKNKGVLHFRRGNQQDLIKQINILVSDHKLRNQLGQNARKYAEEKLSWNRIAEQSLKL